MKAGNSTQCHTQPAREKESERAANATFVSVWEVFKFPSLAHSHTDMDGGLESCGRVHVSS